MKKQIILLLFYFFYLHNANSQTYIKLVLSKKSINNPTVSSVPDYGSLLETILSEINLRRDVNCLSSLNSDIEKRIMSERTKLGKIENRGVNFDTDGIEFLLGIDYKNCKVISLFKNDSPALWSASTLIFRIKLYPLIKISNTLTI